MKLYNEIKAELLAAREADQNAQEWKFIANDHRKDARLLAATAKKLDPSLQDVTVNDILNRIKDEILDEVMAAENRPADSDLEDYAPGDIPANNDPADFEAPVEDDGEEEQEA